MYAGSSEEKEFQDLGEGITGGFLEEMPITAGLLGSVMISGNSREEGRPPNHELNDKRRAFTFLLVFQHEFQAFVGYSHQKW